MRQATEAAGLDSQAFGWVVDKIAGRTVRALRPYDDIGARYVDELEGLAHFVDQFGQEPADATPVATATDESVGQQ